MEDFWPISCYNVIYKCIFKILANRFRVWLPNFISGNQFVFVPRGVLPIIFCFVKSWFGFIILIMVNLDVL